MVKDSGLFVFYFVRITHPVSQWWDEKEKEKKTPTSLQLPDRNPYRLLDKRVETSKSLTHALRFTPFLFSSSLISCIQPSSRGLNLILGRTTHRPPGIK